MKMGDASGFGWPDYLVFGLFLVLSLVAGLLPAYRGQRIKTLESYLMADRSMHPLLVSLSLLVSATTTVTFLAGPVEVYSYGIAYCGMMLGSLVGIVLIAHFIAPAFNKLKLTSIYEVTFYFTLHFKLQL